MFKLGLFLTLVVLGSAAYSQVLGEKLGRLTVASYCRKAQIERWSCAPCKNSPLVMSNVRTFENSSMDTLGFIGTSSQLNAIVLVFRGTLPWDIKNWISDINFLTTDYPICNNSTNMSYLECKVHRGFYYAFTDIKVQVLDTVALYKQKYGLQNVVITGHSLGAAIATHAAAHLIANGTKVTELYTLGSPRVGDPKFTIWFNEVYGKDHFKARITHHKDPVPHLPFEDWGFLHVNTEVFYKGTKKQGAQICNDATGEDKKCSNQYWTDADVLDHVTYFDIDYTGIVLACQK